VAIDINANAENVRVMTTREKVLAIYPTAECTKLAEINFWMSLVVKSPGLFVIQYTTDVGEFCAGSGDTEKVAWDCAWERISNKMLDILEM
jgi:hypothetical protein